jgi:hypothetical protein
MVALVEGNKASFLFVQELDGLCHLTLHGSFMSIYAIYSCHLFVHVSFSLHSFKLSYILESQDLTVGAVMEMTASFVSRDKASFVAFRKKECYIDACCIYAMRCSPLLHIGEDGLAVLCECWPHLTIPNIKDSRNQGEGFMTRECKYCGI